MWTRRPPVGHPWSVTIMNYKQNKQRTKKKLNKWESYFSLTKSHPRRRGNLFPRHEQAQGNYNHSAERNQSNHLQQTCHQTRKRPRLLRRSLLKLSSPSATGFTHPLRCPLFISTDDFRSTYLLVRGQRALADVEPLTCLPDQRWEFCSNSRSLSPSQGRHLFITFWWRFFFSLSSEILSTFP